MLELLQQQYADDPSGSITLAGTIIAQAHAEHDPGTRAYASLYLGLAQCFTAQYDSAMESLETAHTYFTEQADPAGIMLSLTPWADSIWNLITSTMPCTVSSSSKTSH